MESSESDPMTRTVARTSMMDSIIGCSISGPTILKSELKMKMMMPQHIRFAIRDAAFSKNADAGLPHYDADGEQIEAPEAPVVVFINSRSGGRQGPELKVRLQELISEEQVFDLSTVKPREFVEYALGCLEKFADLGESCARLTREKLRVVFRGGEWREAFMQIDGEPWKQPMDTDYSTFVKIKRVPFQSVMPQSQINGLLQTKGLSVVRCA